ncbi:MAG: hypothetical protein AAGI51_07115 [Pseudomonadota bacterium]
MPDGGDQDQDRAGAAERPEAPPDKLIARLEAAHELLSMQAKREGFSIRVLLGSVIGAAVFFVGLAAFDSYQLASALQEAGARVDAEAADLAEDRDAARADLEALRAALAEDRRRLAALDAQTRGEIARALGRARPERAVAVAFGGGPLVFDAAFGLPPRPSYERPGVPGVDALRLSGFYQVRVEGAPGRFLGAYLAFEGPIADRLVAQAAGPAYADAFYRDGFFDADALSEIDALSGGAFIPAEGGRRFRVVLNVEGESCDALEAWLAGFAEAPPGAMGRISVRPVLADVARPVEAAVFDIALGGPPANACLDDARRAVARPGRRRPGAAEADGG